MSTWILTESIISPNLVHYNRFENLSIFSSSYKKKIVEDFTLKHLLLFEICARGIFEKFVYKHSEIIEYVKN